MLTTGIHNIFYVKSKDQTPEDNYKNALHGIIEHLSLMEQMRELNDSNV